MQLSHRLGSSLSNSASSGGRQKEPVDPMMNSVNIKTEDITRSKHVGPRIEEQARFFRKIKFVLFSALTTNAIEKKTFIANFILVYRAVEGNCRMFINTYATTCIGT